MAHLSRDPCRERCAILLREQEQDAITAKIAHREALREWLPSLGWDVFFTITFKNPREPHHALSTLNQVAKGIRQSWNPRRLFIGTELHYNRTLHLHGIWGNYGKERRPLSRETRADIWEHFFELYGRSEVRNIQSVEAVTAYCTKYVTKALTEYLIQ